MKTPLTLICFSLVLLGCSTLSPVPVTTPSAIASEKTSQGQQLPITATMKIGRETIELEVAKTPEQQEIGLMYRTQLSANRGMVFDFSPPRVARFWMKNTLIPLDIIFLSQGQIKWMAVNTPPCKSDPCPVYGPFVEVDQVVEPAAGRAKSLNLNLGDRLEIVPIKTEPVKKGKSKS